MVSPHHFRWPRINELGRLAKQLGIKIVTFCVGCQMHDNENLVKLAASPRLAFHGETIGDIFRQIHGLMDKGLQCSVVEEAGSESCLC